MTERQSRQVRVVFRKAVSDGNYGTEMAEVMLEWWSETGDDADADTTSAETMLHAPRRAPGPFGRDRPVALPVEDPF